jgi:S-adenosylmethionine-dependent methyltransferase
VSGTYSGAPAGAPAAGRAGPAAAGSGVAAGGRSGARTAVVWEALLAVLEGRAQQAGTRRLDIVDAGGGTGGLAVPLASLGHNVIVVDPSPNSLAAAQRRAAEAGVELHAVQGDVTDLPAITGEGATEAGRARRTGADLVLCHSVLEYVDDPASAVATIARVLRPGGTASVLAASAIAAAIHRALAGNFDEARQLIEGTSGPRDGVSPDDGPDDGQASATRRFTLPALTQLIEKAGMRPGAAHGVRVFSDLVPSSLVDGDPGAEAALLALEGAAAQHPALRDIATQLHVLGHR